MINARALSEQIAYMENLLVSFNPVTVPVAEKWMTKTASDHSSVATVALFIWNALDPDIGHVTPNHWLPWFFLTNTGRSETQS